MDQNEYHKKFLQDRWHFRRDVAVGYIIFFTMVLLMAVWTESLSFFLKLFITAAAVGVLWFLLWLFYRNKD